MSDGITIKKVEIMGMELEEWSYKSCVAHFGVEATWSTLYKIVSSVKNQGQATLLLTVAKKYYEKRGKKFGGTVALNPVMRYIYKKLNIKEYE